MMDIVLQLCIFILALGGLIFFSNWFVTFAEDLGLKWKLSPFVIGIVIVSLGTSLPELLSSIVAVLKGYSEIVVGNAAGSNIANILLVLGASAFLAKNSTFKNTFLKRDLLILGIVTVVVVLLSYNSIISFVEGLLLTCILIGYLIFQAKQDTRHDKHKSIYSYMVLIPGIILTCVGIFYGAKFTVSSAVFIGSTIGISYDVISASAIAIGTSLPELFVSVMAAKKGKMEMAVGNVLGSNVFNLLGVIGIPALLGNLIILQGTQFVVLPALLISTVFFTYIVQDAKVTKKEGLIALALYCIFLVLLFI